MDYEWDQHQAFIIAKINERYRGLAVIQTTDDFAIDELIDIRLSLVEIFKDPQNHPPILAELAWASKQHAKSWDTKQELKAKPEFPYIHTCLHIAAANATNGNSRRCPVARVMSLPFNTAFDMVDNQQGIIVMDITDLSQPRSAFLRPLTDAQHLNFDYMYSYNYSDSEADEDIDENEINTFEEDKDFDYDGLLDVEALRNVWPHCMWFRSLPYAKLTLDCQSMPDSDSEGVHQNSANAIVSAMGSPEPPLKRIALRKIFFELLSSPPQEVVSSIEHARLIFDFWPAIKSMFYKHPEAILKASDFAATRLLTGALECETEISLHPFQLTEKQVRAVLSKHRNLVSLDLSGNTNITADGLRSIVANNPNLHTLSLLYTPQIPMREKVRLIGDTRISHLFDTEMLRLPYGAEKNANEGAVDEGGRNMWHPGGLSPSQHPKLETAPLPSQIVVLFSNSRENRLDQYQFPKGGFDLDMTDHPRNRHDLWCPYGLGGVFLPLLPFFNSLVGFTLECSTENFKSDWGSIYKRIGAKLRDSFWSSGNQIRSLPYIATELPKVSKLPYAENLRHGEWSFFLTIKDQSPKTLQYTFLSAEPESSCGGQAKASVTGLIKEDLKGYLDRTVEVPELRRQVLDNWNERLGETLTVCPTEQIEEFLQTNETYTKAVIGG
ncbi:hypothetical protein HYFRA_00002612 [Hymenoscyphus fraxineus]|uniref:Uncharacterized protein n=1 Tax=Hymenoscyphus fraxineus TaxID=746836 RepID=A0A9N9PZ50_9HELO|nr:hypothetical protein HYFRA_00002612 [Hymenoscyphus fraxineus]